MKHTWIKLSEAAKMLGHPARSSACKSESIPRFWRLRKIRIRKMPYFWYACLTDVETYIKAEKAKNDAIANVARGNEKKSKA